MALRKFNPITPGMRHKVLSKFEEITTDKPHKPLLEPIKKSGGRNSDGKMTMRYRGGGHKRRYRVIDFKRNKHMEATQPTAATSFTADLQVVLAVSNGTDDGQARHQDLAGLAAWQLQHSVLPIAGGKLGI